MQVWLQDFAWTEQEHSRKVAERRVQRGCATQLRSASMFCFETAIRMFYWSTLVRCVHDCHAQHQLQHI
jgi:hypothetical protein